jgi:hypothetical protein
MLQEILSHRYDSLGTGILSVNIVKAVSKILLMVRSLSMLRCI